LRLLRCSLWPLASRLGAVLVVALARTRKHKFDYVKAGVLTLLHQHVTLGDPRVVVPAARVAVESLAELLTAPPPAPEEEKQPPPPSPSQETTAAGNNSPSMIPRASLPPPKPQQQTQQQQQRVRLLQRKVSSSGRGGGGGGCDDDDESDFDFDVILGPSPENGTATESDPLVRYLKQHNPRLAVTVRNLKAQQEQLRKEKVPSDSAIGDPEEHARKQQERLQRLVAEEKARLQRKLQRQLEREEAGLVAGDEANYDDDEEDKEEEEENGGDGNDGATPGIDKAAEKAAALQQRLAAVEQELSRLEKDATEERPMGLTLRRCRVASSVASSGSSAWEDALQVVAVAAGSAAERGGAEVGDLLVAVDGASSGVLSKALTDAAKAEANALARGNSIGDDDDSASPPRLLTLTFRRGDFELVEENSTSLAADEGNKTNGASPSSSSFRGTSSASALLFSREDMSVFSDSWATSKATVGFNQPQNVYFPLGIQPTPKPTVKAPKPLGKSWSNRRAKSKVWYDS
jgi:hypothetical protein